MSFEKANADLEAKGLGDHIIVLNESSATVAEAAHALGVEPAMIAKTLSVLQGETPVLIVTEGTARLDNHKYKSLFHIKAKMIPYDDVETLVGHAPGGVCPFGINEGVEVYLDESLRKFETVYPAAGNGHTAVRLTLPELEAAPFWTNRPGRVSVFFCGMRKRGCKSASGILLHPLRQCIDGLLLLFFGGERRDAVTLLGAVAAKTGVAAAFQNHFGRIGRQAAAVGAVLFAVQHTPLCRRESGLS